MIWIALITLISGVAAYHASGRQSKNAEWAIGAGLILLFVAGVQSDHRDLKACKNGSEQACADLDARQDALDNVRP